jgi:hypothetical protein
MESPGSFSPQREKVAREAGRMRGQRRRRAREVTTNLMN